VFASRVASACGGNENRNWILETQMIIGRIWKPKMTNSLNRSRENFGSALYRRLLDDLDAFDRQSRYYQALVMDIDLDVWSDLSNRKISAILNGDVALVELERLADMHLPEPGTPVQLTINV
jgi:hypothetical protein